MKEVLEEVEKRLEEAKGTVREERIQDEVMDWREVSSNRV